MVSRSTGTCGLRTMAARASRNWIRKERHWRILTIGTGPGAGFDRPHRVAMDPSGDVWVLNEHSLTKLSGSGSLIGQFPIHGPQSVGRELAVDQSGRVWVADQDGVAVLSPTGKPLVHYDNSNAPGASFRAPDAIAILGDSAWIANGQAGSITKIAAAGMGSEFFPYGGPARTTGPRWPRAR